jgi:transcriptional regulator with XRE-family HTH domain
MRVVVSGKRLRVLRAEAGLTQQELAYKAGVNRAVIGRVERDEDRDVRVSNLYGLTKALSRMCGRHVSMEDLMIEIEDAGPEK